MNNSRKILSVLFVIFIVFCTKNVIAKDNEININNVEQLQNNEVDKNNNIGKLFKKNKEQKKLEDITIFDVVKEEKISPELRQKILDLIDQYQYDLDSYRSIIANHYKKAELKLVGVQKDINGINNFKDEVEENLNLAKWMIISLSVGVVCLTTIVIIMWKGVINVNRNDVEVIFSLEKIKKDLRLTNKRIDILEEACTNNGKKQISNNYNT
ncbi:MAG TPA: hypothetical protein VLL98_01420 [Rickettsiales bacterium]|nr:hypothetical protein [Rickettsiales bacterium]